MFYQKVVTAKPPGKRIFQGLTVDKYQCFCTSERSLFFPSDDWLKNVRGGVLKALNWLVEPGSDKLHLTDDGTVIIRFRRLKWFTLAFVRICYYSLRMLFLGKCSKLMGLTTYELTLSVWPLDPRRVPRALGKAFMTTMCRWALALPKDVLLNSEREAIELTLEMRAYERYCFRESYRLKGGRAITVARKFGAAHVPKLQGISFLTSWGVKRIKQTTRAPLSFS